MTTPIKISKEAVEVAAKICSPSGYSTGRIERAEHAVQLALNKCREETLREAIIVAEDAYRMSSTYQQETVASNIRKNLQLLITKQDGKEGGDK